VTSGMLVVQSSNVQITENMDQIVIKRVLVQELYVTTMEFVLNVSKLTQVKNVKFVLVKTVEIAIEINALVLLAFLENFAKFQNVIQEYHITIAWQINVNATKFMKVQIVDIVNAGMVGFVRTQSVNARYISKVNFVKSINVGMVDRLTVKIAHVQKIIMELFVKNQNVDKEEEFLKELVIISAIAPKITMECFVKIVNAKMAELVLLMDVNVHHLLKATFVNNRNVKMEEESTLEI
jgi:hypothetical protein